MTKKLYVIFLIFYGLMMQNASGQIQTGVQEVIKQKFQKYTEAVPREEIYIHTDRDLYISGEELWFNIYLIDRQSFRPSANSRIVYFELLNAVNRPVVQKRILIDKGSGPGQIHLPDSLGPGTYTIRAYTNWMKNFLPDNCFMKDIKIYNAFSKKAFRERIYKNNSIGEKDNTGIMRSHLKLNVNNTRGDSLELLIYADDVFHSEKGNIIYPFVETHGQVNHVSSEKVSVGNTKICIARNELIPGINHITVFDSGGKPLEEKYIYTPLKYDKVLHINSDSIYNKRSKVSIDIDSKNEFAQYLKLANLSISIAPKSNDKEIDIDSYMVFGTEFGLPASKINEFKDLPTGAMDSILQNIKSNWIDWSRILAEDHPESKYPVENEEHILFGKLLDSVQNPANHSEIVLLCIPGKKAEFQYARTDNEGNFSFSLGIKEGLNDLIIMPDEADKNHKIIMGSSFYDKYPEAEMITDSATQVHAPEISMLSFNYQVAKIYGDSSYSNQRSEALPANKVRFYGKPDIELIMADYISLPKMEEVFFELLPHVYMKKIDSGYEISLTDHIYGDKYKLSPVLLIDGVVIKDASLIANLDPETVEEIDVIQGKYFVGRYIFYGLVNVITKSGNFSCVALPDYMIRLPYRIAESVPSFVTPGYTTEELKNSRLPDFRNTLFWDASVKSGSDRKMKIDFWTSDVATDYVISIQGISSDGKLISEKKILKVQ